MASIINATTTNGVAISADNSGILQLATNSGTTAVTIDASQNVGIGTASPGAKFAVGNGTDQVQAGISGATSIIYFGTPNTASGGQATLSYNRATGLTSIGASSPGVSLGSSMNVDLSGNLLVGTTSASSSGKVVINQGSGYLLSAIGGTLTGSQTWRHWLGNSGTSAYYIINDSNTGVYLAYGGTSWTANSDERLKDIIEPIADAATKVSSLRAVIGKYKTDEEGRRRSFLIAQDVQAVLPEAVSVGMDDMLGVQYTEVIPLLVAAIKEQQAIITQLQTQITALNAKVGI